MINNFVFEHWKHNSGFETRWLRRITRETKKHWIADCQRICAGENYRLMKKVGQKFVKTSNGIKRSISHLDNTDGVMSLSIVQPKNIKSPVTFAELFQKDLRTILEPNSYFLEQMSRRTELAKQNNPEYSRPETDYFLESYLYPASAYNSRELVEYLQKTFQVNKVLEYLGSIYLQSILEDCLDKKLEQSATFFHITHFGNDKEIVTFEENKNNGTIMFWLFDDQLIFAKCFGINTW